MRDRSSQTERRGFFATFKPLWSNNDLTFAFLLFLTNALLIAAFFFPSLSDINAWDEAGYAHNGQILLDHGEWPTLADNPATAAFFAISYLPFRASPLWMIYSITVARMLLFALIWWGAFLVARQLSEFASPMIALGFLFVTPLSVEFLRFPSDPLFAGFAALSLWQLLRFHKNREHKHLARASILMAVAALARSDGLVLFIILVLITFILEYRRVNWAVSLAAVSLPFLGIVGGYVILVGIITGSLHTGIAERTYQNFESGQQQITTEIEGINPVIEARLEARELFGTAEENRNSVFRAIARNPNAYADRLITVIKLLPETLLKAYGIRFSAVIFLFVLRGFIELLREKRYHLLLILVLWPLHLVSGLIITLFRTGHLQFPYYIVFAFAAIGLNATLSNLDQLLERRWISAALLGLVLYGIVDNKLAIYFGAVLTWVGLWAVILIRRWSQLTTAGAFLILLCAGLILRGGFPSPAFRRAGVDPKEQMVTFLVENYQPDTTIASGSPGVVWAAKMKNASLTSTDVPSGRLPDEFVSWMKTQRIDLIYVDLDLYGLSPALWQKIEAQIGDGLQRVFTLEGGNFQILEFTDEL